MTRRPLRADGSFVLVAGPDGAGKSTLTESLANGELTTRPVVRLHHRPSVLPTRTSGPVVEPHARPPYRRGTSLLKLAYVFVDFWLGWLVHVLPVLRRGGVAVLERGWWDLLVDPRRYRLRSGRFVRVLGHLLPQPDLAIVLEGQPDALHDRKPELSTEEIARQSAAWHQALPSTVPRVFVDATQSYPQVLAEAAAAFRDTVDGGRGCRPARRRP